MDEKQTVLIIEDEEDIRELYTDVLRDGGFEVIQAADGDSGLDSAQNEEWDIMLLDIMIPQLDGIALLKNIKNNDKLKSKPILLLTNLGSEDLITQAFQLGADGYLIKAEITPDHILNEVTNYLKR
jgi:DNA-binding response OmpR family regulator